MEEIELCCLREGWYEALNERYERLVKDNAPQSIIDVVKMQRDWNPDSEMTYRLKEIREHKELLKANPMKEYVVQEIFRRFDLMMANVPLDTKSRRFGHCDSEEYYYHINGGEIINKLFIDSPDYYLSDKCRKEYRMGCFENGLCLYGYEVSNQFETFPVFDQLDWMDDEYCKLIINPRDIYGNKIGAVYEPLIESLYTQLAIAIMKQ